MNSKKILMFIEKVEGKEQLIRLVQYFAFAVHAALKNTRFVNFAQKAQKLSGNLSITRKVLRFGMPFAVVLNVFHRFSSKRDKVLKLFGDFFSLVFYLTDHLLYFYRIRLITLGKGSKRMQHVDILRNFAWVAFLVVKIVDSTMEIHKVQSKIQKLSAASSFSYRNIEANMFFTDLLKQSDGLMLGIIRNCLDIPVALYFLDSIKIHPVLVGILGTLSSLVQIYKEY